MWALRQDIGTGARDAFSHGPKSSAVILGLDPRIHSPPSALELMDPRLKGEDDAESGLGAPATRNSINYRFFALCSKGLSDPR